MVIHEGELYWRMNAAHKNVFFAHFCYDIDKIQGFQVGLLCISVVERERL